MVIIINRVFCPGAGSSLQTQAPRPQSCPKAGLPPPIVTQSLRESGGECQILMKER